MRTFVWVDAWQQQCCGEPFGVGAEVRWEVDALQTGSDWVELLLGGAWAARVRFHQQRHDDAGAEISGTVLAIHDVTCRRMTAGDDERGPWVPVPTSGMLRSVDFADPWQPDLRRDASELVSFDGWIVELDVAEPLATRSPTA